MPNNYAELAREFFSPHTRLFPVLISVMMVVTGSMNTLAAKWADKIWIEPEHRLFNHPFFQALCMFIGEFMCLLVFLGAHYVRRWAWRRRNIRGDGGAAALELDAGEEPALPSGFNPLVFLPPTCCDVIGTSLMYIGLNLTSASSFQMLRGSVIIFTGLLSVAFLRAKLRGYQWLGMGLVTSGLIVVGLSDIAYNGVKTDTNSIITGDLLIIMAQIIVAIQMVTEQRYLTQYDVPPLLAVGLEGLFGICILSVLLVPMYFIHVPSIFSSNPENRLEDVIFALKEIGERPVILLALFCLIISIAFFNFAGVTVTKTLTATTRMVLDSVRTLIIWAFSIPLFGDPFIALQLVGFALLIGGMFIYNDLWLGPRFRRDVLPRMVDWNPSIGLCCTQFCGVQLLEDEDGPERLLSRGGSEEDEYE